MMEMIEANWPLLLVAFLIGLVIAWFLFNANRRTKVTGERSDVLDEGAAPAARNQALIDSAPSASAGVPKEAARGCRGGGRRQRGGSTGGARGGRRGKPCSRCTTRPG